MKFSTRSAAVERLRTEAIWLPVTGGKQLGRSGEALDKASGGRISAALASGDLPAKAGSTLLVRLDGSIRRALLVSFGDSAEVSEKHWTEAVRAAFRAAATVSIARSVSVFMHFSLSD